VQAPSVPLKLQAARLPPPDEVFAPTKRRLPRRNRVQNRVLRRRERARPPPDSRIRSGRNRGRPGDPLGQHLGSRRARGRPASASRPATARHAGAGPNSCPRAWTCEQSPRRPPAAPVHHATRFFCRGIGAAVCAPQRLSAVEPAIGQRPGPARSRRFRRVVGRSGAPEPRRTPRVAHPANSAKARRRAWPPAGRAARWSWPPAPLHTTPPNVPLTGESQSLAPQASRRSSPAGLMASATADIASSGVPGPRQPAPQRFHGNLDSIRAPLRVESHLANAPIGRPPGSAGSPFDRGSTVPAEDD